jgi:hypothetical protein
VSHVLFFAKYYYNEEMDVDGIDRACSILGRLQKCLHNFCINSDGRISLGRSGLRWEDNGSMKKYGGSFDLVNYRDKHSLLYC